jgi:hypothetical protein
MKSIDRLTEEDYIAFGFNYNEGEPNEIIVNNITSIYEDRVLVHFLYGYKSLAEFVKKEDILAIGNEEGEGKIKGWTGKYDILNQERINKILNTPKYI